MDKSNGQLKRITVKNRFIENAEARRKHENFGLTSENLILKVIKTLVIAFI